MHYNMKIVVKQGAVFITVQVGIDRQARRCNGEKGIKWWSDHHFWEGWRWGCCYLIRWTTTTQLSEILILYFCVHSERIGWCMQQRWRVRGRASPATSQIQPSAITAAQTDLITFLFACFAGETAPTGPQCARPSVVLWFGISLNGADMAKSWTGQCLCTENRNVTINIQAQQEHRILLSQHCFLLELAFQILIYFAGD